MLESRDDVGDLAGVKAGLQSHGLRPVEHDGEPGAGQRPAQLDGFRVVRTEGSRAQKYQHGGALLAVGDDEDLRFVRGAVVAEESCRHPMGLRRQQALRLHRAGEHLPHEGNGMQEGHRWSPQHQRRDNQRNRRLCRVQAAGVGGRLRDINRRYMAGGNRIRTALGVQAASV